jgi:hypothetical protein
MRGIRAVDTHRVDRVPDLVDKFLVRIGLKRRTARDRYIAEIDSSTISAEQRREALRNAAADPQIESILDDADKAIDQHVKGRTPGGDVHSRSVTPGHSGR